MGASVVFKDASPSLVMLRNERDTGFGNSGYTYGEFHEGIARQREVGEFPN